MASGAPSATVKTCSADVTNERSLKPALERAVSDVGAPEVVLYNAARIINANIGEYSAEDIIHDFRVPNLGLHTTACILMPHLQSLAKSNPSAHPSLFMTSGAIIHKPVPSVLSLCMAKATQASLTKVIADENQGVVHVAMVTVGGVVSPEEKLNNPDNIATKFWELYQQKEDNWAFEMKCRW